ncbi:MAG TPA: MCE family protein [Acidimicrobiales bacterium]|jgi:phospholipid/cholesterol/gamma-HCH transport system substrate-binding protein|nr:MCE family protein [Acidimicrobiales bacterium]
MTAATAPSRTDGQSRFSIESLQESRNGRAIAGLLLAAGTALIVWLIVSAFTGRFTDLARIHGQLPAGSNAVQVAAPIEYLNVTVGKVGAETRAANGNVDVVFEIYPKNLPLIPKGVQAQVAPLSIFGNQYINLVPPRTFPPGHLEASDIVGPYTGQASSSLQGTVTQVSNLLNAIHPAQLDTALTALAEALNGQGTALGQGLTNTSKYLGQAVVPNLHNLESDLQMLAPASSTVQQASPSILGTLSNSATTGQTITQQEAQLHTLLTNGTDAVGQFGHVLQQVQAGLPRLLNQSGPLLADVTRNPNELSQTLSGLTTFASAVAAQEQSGPYLKVNVTLPVANISAGVNAALGYDNPTSIDQALGSAVNPPTYTSANCPQYPGLTNTHCGTGGSPAIAGTLQMPAGSSVAAASTGSGSGASGTADAVTAGDLVSAAATDPGTAEEHAAQAIAIALSGGQVPSAPGLADVVLIPLLHSIVGG